MPHAAHPLARPALHAASAQPPPRPASRQPDGECPRGVARLLRSAAYAGVGRTEGVETTGLGIHLIVGHSWRHVELAGLKDEVAQRGVVELDGEVAGLQGTWERGGRRTLV